MDKMPLEFELHLNADQHQFGKNDTPDFFEDFVETAKLAGTIGRNGNQIAESFREETAIISEQHASIYKGIAARAEAQTPLQKRATSEWDEVLVKRSSGVVVSSGYRAWFENGIALGKTASGMLAEWFAANPNHSADVAAELRRVAAEF